MCLNLKEEEEEEEEELIAHKMDDLRKAGMAL